MKTFDAILGAAGGIADNAEGYGFRITGDAETPDLIVTIGDVIGEGNSTRLTIDDDATMSTFNKNVTINDDLFVNDYARIDALRVGTTSSDPGDGRLYVEDYGVFVGGLRVGSSSDPGANNLSVANDITGGGNLAIDSGLITVGDSGLIHAGDLGCGLTFGTEVINLNADNGVNVSHALDVGGDLTAATITMTGKIDTSGEVEAEHLHSTDDIEVGDAVFHSGDTDTRMRFDTNTILLYDDTGALVTNFTYRPGTGGWPSGAFGTGFSIENKYSTITTSIVQTITLP